MKYLLTLFGLTILSASLALPQASTAAKKKMVTTQKSSASKTAAAPKASAAKAGSKTGTAKKTTTASASRKGKPGAKRPMVTSVARSRQMTPTPERYKEIEQALAEKGYLKSEPDGVWDADSADALKQFQTDKNLPPTGKITAASLIGLGLGPRLSDSPADIPPPSVPPPNAAGSPSNPPASN